MTTWAFTIFGAPRTKKNHGSVIQRGNRRFHIPSAAWTQWVKTADIAFQDPLQARAWYANGHILCPVNCRALFYRDARRGDAVGYYQGLADLLEKRGIVADDVQIESWDGTRLLLDRARPRVEVLITPLEDQEAVVHAEQASAPASTGGQR